MSFCRTAPGIILVALIMTWGDSDAHHRSAARTGQQLEVVQAVFDEYCVACHNSAQALGGLNLQAGYSRSALIGVRANESAVLRVDPGNPDKSYLYLKITGRQFEVGGQGQLMPLGGIPLPAEEVQVIRHWIASLAGDARH